MREALGSDHGGFELKQEIIKYLEEKKIEYKDYGCYSTESTDYPIYAKKVAHGILEGECELGILVCGTGIGISITANKIKGIRAAVCTDCFTAEATRLHNDANILALGGRVVGPGLADKIVEAVKSGAIRKFVVMAGCDGRAKSRNYYSDFAKGLPKDTVILTAGCAKYKYNKLDLGDIGM